jgi:hypothetical protein
MDAETYLRLMAEKELRRALARPREPEPSPRDRASAWSCLRRLRYVATGLTVVDAIDRDVADAIVGELDAALVVRSRLHWNRLIARPHGAAGRQVGPRSAPVRFIFPNPGGGSAESARAMPVGRALLIRDGGGVAADACLISMIRTEDREILAVAASVREPDRSRPFHHPFHQIEAVDELGSSYHVNFHGGFGNGRADGWLTVRPVLPSGLRWLELHSGPGTPRLRVDVTADPTPADVHTEPAEQTGPGERLLDRIAAELLSTLPDRHPGQVSLDETVAALEELGILPPGSPAPGRLAELCRQGGFGVGQGLVAALAAGRIPPAELPGPWASVVAHFHRGNPPAAKQGVAPVAVALPEFDGARFVIVGIESHDGRATLTGLVFGLFANHAHQGRDCPCWMRWFPWWIRDDTGQWHVAAFSEFSSSDRESATFGLRLVPPLAEPVTRLDMIIPGPSLRITVRVPVEWMAAEHG